MYRLIQKRLVAMFSFIYVVVTLSFFAVLGGHTHHHENSHDPFPNRCHMHMNAGADISLLQDIEHSKIQSRFQTTHTQFFYSYSVVSSYAFLWSVIEKEHISNTSITQRLYTTLVPNILQTQRLLL